MQFSHSFLLPCLDSLGGVHSLQGQLLFLPVSHWFDFFLFFFLLFDLLRLEVEPLTLTRDGVEEEEDEDEEGLRDSDPSSSDKTSSSSNSTLADFSTWGEVVVIVVAMGVNESKEISWFLFSSLDSFDSVSVEAAEEGSESKPTVDVPRISTKGVQMHFFPFESHLTELVVMTAGEAMKPNRKVSDGTPFTKMLEIPWLRLKTLKIKFEGDFNKGR